MSIKSSKMTKAAFGSLLISATVAGCAVGPDYAKPSTALAPFHNQARVQAIDPAGQVAIDEWWKGFKDPMLTEVVERALSQNLDLAASVARVQQARATAAGAGAELLPTADLNASASYARQSLEGTIGSIASGSPRFSRGIHEYRIGPAASWEIDLFGGLRRAADAAGAEALAAEADQVGTRIIVAADAADAYLQIRGYQARLAIAEQQIKDDEHLLQLVRDRYRAGAATGREVAQADALLRQARASIPALSIGQEQQLNRLDVLMGVQRSLRCPLSRAAASRQSCFAVDQTLSQRSADLQLPTSALAQHFQSITRRSHCPAPWASTA